MTLSDQLRDHLDQLAEPITLDEVVVGAPGRQRFRLPIVAAAVAAVLALVAGGLWLVTSSDDGENTIAATTPTPGPDVDGTDVTEDGAD